MLKKFQGSFDALTKVGSSYEIHQRFRPLHGEGKPLWEFKEHDHRLYCVRIPNGKYVTVVLLGGWTKDKSGLSNEEREQVRAAKNLHRELMDEEGSAS